MKKTAAIIGILLLAGAIAYPVFAHGPGWGRGAQMWGYGGGPGSCWRGYDDSRGLTQEQREKLDALERKFFTETDTLRNELWSKKAGMNTLLSAQDPDEAKITSLQKEINDLRNQMAEKQVTYQLETRKIAPDAYYGGNAGRYSGGGGRFRGDFGQGRCWN